MEPAKARRNRIPVSCNTCRVRKCVRGQQHARIMLEGDADGMRADSNAIEPTLATTASREASPALTRRSLEAVVQYNDNPSRDSMMSMSEFGISSLLSYLLCGTKAETQILPLQRTLQTTAPLQIRARRLSHQEAQIQARTVRRREAVVVAPLPTTMHRRT